MTVNREKVSNWRSVITGILVICDKVVDQLVLFLMPKLSMIKKAVKLVTYPYVLGLVIAAKKKNA